MQFAERDFLKNSLRKMLNSTHVFLLESVLLIILVFSVRKINIYPKGDFQTGADLYAVKINN
jgi:hypothetical protein